MILSFFAWNGAYRGIAVFLIHERWHYGEYEKSYYQAFVCVHLFVYVVIRSERFPQSRRAFGFQHNILCTVIWCWEKSPGRAWRSKQSHERLSLFSGDKHSLLWSDSDYRRRDGRGAQKGWNLCRNNKIPMIFCRSHKPTKQNNPSRGEGRGSYFTGQVQPESLSFFVEWRSSISKPLG